MTEIDYDLLKVFDKIVITYSGSGDEGYIDDIQPEPKLEGLELSRELQEYLEAVAYDILEDNWAGWEINEGSHGHMTINVKERNVFLHHGEIVESTNWHDSVIQ